jgi:hypothetical protein
MARARKHDWYLNGDSTGVFEDDYDREVDIFRRDADIHNGPECKRCGRKACHHCEPGVYEESCP